MKEKKIVYVHKASAKEYLYSLLSNPEYTKLINPTNKPYEKIHNWLLENEAKFKDDNSPLPSIKEMANTLKLDSAKVTKFLIALYNDIMELNNNEPKRFKKEGQHLCYLTFNRIGCCASFNIGLNTIPSVNEIIEFYFTRPINGGSLYYVTNIYHELKGFNHTINISLNCDHPNLYLQLLKEKAHLHRDISDMEYFFPMDMKMKEDLIRRHRQL